MESGEKQIKVGLLGGPDAGKTSLCLRIKDGKFEEVANTVQVNFYEKTITHDGSTYILKLYDTAGQEKFQSTSFSALRDVHVILYVYDITSKESYDALESFIRKSEENLSQSYKKILVGAKYDLNKQSQTKNLNNYQDVFDDQKYVSSKTGYQIDELLELIVKNYLKISDSDKETQELQIKKNTSSCC